MNYVSNSRPFPSKSWIMLRIQSFLIQIPELCLEFKTFLFKSWIMFRIQYFLFKIMNYASNSILVGPKYWIMGAFGSQSGEFESQSGEFKKSVRRFFGVSPENFIIYCTRQSREYQYILSTHKGRVGKGWLSVDTISIEINRETLTRSTAQERVGGFIHLPDYFIW